MDGQEEKKPSSGSNDNTTKKLNAKDLKELLGNMSVGSSLPTSSAPKGLDQGDHKFWGTQPVPWKESSSATSSTTAEAEAAAAAKAASKAAREGPIDPNTDISKIPTDPSPLLEGFEWVTLDMTKEGDIADVYNLLALNYVEDAEAMFRFNYSSSFLNWALKSPGWRAEWHIGIRASTSRKLVAFISGVPVTLAVRDTQMAACEVNFMNVHKKLRSKRLAPVLIREITRRCNAVGVWQAVYTAGALVHPPVAVCRYYHRALDWSKLFDVGFSPLPAGSSKARQLARYKLPEKTVTAGLRPMELGDVPAVQKLLARYLAKRSAMAQRFDEAEIAHWLLNSDTGSTEQVVWTYVVTDAAGHITDFFSFYELASTVIGNAKHSTIRAAYLFYYASETGLTDPVDDAALKTRLNALMGDALVLAKTAGFDVFNALSLLDNPLFLAEQKFGAGDGRLHYYLYNYRTAPMPGGLDERSMLDTSKMGGVGVVML